MYVCVFVYVLFVRCVCVCVLCVVCVVCCVLYDGYAGGNVVAITGHTVCVVCCMIPTSVYVMPTTMRHALYVV